MADKLIPSPFDPTCIIRHKDMGDGSWAPVSTQAVTSGAGGYPPGAVPVTSSSGNVAAASAIATLAAAVGKTTYITGFVITSAGATGAAVVNPTLVGVIGGTMTFVYTTIAGVTLANATLIVSFDVPVPASAVNTAIVLTLPSLGAGNTNAAVVARGYQL